MESSSEPAARKPEATAASPADVSGARASPAGGAAPATAAAAAGSPQIGIAQFQQIDLRVAEVLACEAHPNADRLLVLRVSLGAGEERQIVAGIRAHYAPEQLIGKRVVVVANLEPAKLRGVDSRGMLLAATGADGKVTVITPDVPVAAGSRIK